MTVATQNESIDRYLKALRRAARQLPQAERDELMRSIEEHIGEAVTADSTEAEIRSTLDRLGAPAQLVEDSYGPAPAPRRGRMEWAAIVLLVIGGVVVPFLGWIAGVVLLWASTAWTVREKLVGTFVVPGGLMLALWAGIVISPGESCGGYQQGSTVVRHCTGGASPGAQAALIAALVVLTVAPIVTAVFLARRAARPAQA